jgi:hypothetical protein
MTLKERYFKVLDCSRKAIGLIENGKRMGFYSESSEEGPLIPVSIVNQDGYARKRRAVIEDCLLFNRMCDDLEVKEITDHDLVSIINKILFNDGFSEDDYFIIDFENKPAVIVEDTDQYDKIDDLLNGIPVEIYTRDQVFHCEECSEYHLIDNGYFVNHRFISDDEIVCAKCFKKNLMEYLKRPEMQGVYTSKGGIVKGMHALEPDELPGEPGEAFEDCLACISGDDGIRRFNETCDKEAVYVIVREPVDMLSSNYCVYKLR